MGEPDDLQPATEFQARILRAALKAARDIEREAALLNIKCNGTLSLGIARNGRQIEAHFTRFLGELIISE